MFHETLSMVLITFVINDSIFEEVRPAIPSAGFIEVSCTLNILSHQQNTINKRLRLHGRVWIGTALKDQGKHSHH